MSPFICHAVAFPLFSSLQWLKKHFELFIHIRSRAIPPKSFYTLTSACIIKISYNSLRFQIRKNSLNVNYVTGSLSNDCDTWGVYVPIWSLFEWNRWLCIYFQGVSYASYSYLLNTYCVSGPVPTADMRWWQDPWVYVASSPGSNQDWSGRSDRWGKCVRIEWAGKHTRGHLDFDFRC